MVSEEACYGANKSAAAEKMAPMAGKVSSVLRISPTELQVQLQDGQVLKSSQRIAKLRDYTARWSDRDPQWFQLSHFDINPSTSEELFGANWTAQHLDSFRSDFGAELDSLASMYDVRSSGHTVTLSAQASKTAPSPPPQSGPVCSLWTSVAFRSVGGNQDDVGTQASSSTTFTFKPSRSQHKKKVKEFDLQAHSDAKQNKITRKRQPTKARAKRTPREKSTASSSKKKATKRNPKTAPTTIETFPPKSGGWSSKDDLEKPKKISQAQASGSKHEQAFSSFEYCIEASEEMHEPFNSIKMTKAIQPLSNGFQQPVALDQSASLIHSDNLTTAGGIPNALPENRNIAPNKLNTAKTIHTYTNFQPASRILAASPETSSESLKTHSRPALHQPTTSASQSPACKPQPLSLVDQASSDEETESILRLCEEIESRNKIEAPSVPSVFSSSLAALGLGALGLDPKELFFN